MTKHLIRTSDDLPATHWMARQLPRGASLRGYAEDEAISSVTSAVQDAIDAAGLTRAEVARLLGTTKSYVSQVLNGSTNMTLKTLGALLWAAGRQVTELRTDAIGGEARPQPTAFRLEAQHVSAGSPRVEMPSFVTIEHSFRRASTAVGFHFP